MKQKFLLSMLLGGAMLTACSVDDNLDLAQEAKDAKSSAPVFILSFEDGDNLLTRASYENDKVIFSIEDKDLLSLYNGIDDNEFTGKYQNAVYEAKGSDNEFKLESKAMVVNGKAIMVYPVDTVNVSPTGVPSVKIDAVQNDSTLKLNPYVSPMLEIAERSQKGNVNDYEAGYGRDYNIRMKRMATTFNLKMNVLETNEIKGAVEAEKIKKAVVKSVKLVDEDKLFTISAPLKVTDKEYKTGEGEEETEIKPWCGEVGLNVTSLADKDKSESILSKIKDGSDIAYLTLLPFGSDVNPAISFANTQIVIETTYGLVTLKGDDRYISNPYKNSANTAVSAIKDKDKLTVAEFLQYVVARNVSTSSEAASTADTWTKGEYIGKAFNMTIDVDLSKVDMSLMHIEKSQELEDAITLFNIIKTEPTDKAKFCLVGNEKNTFVMESGAWKALETELAMNTPKITVTLCDGLDSTDDGAHKGYTRCDDITLLGAAENPIPDLKFTDAVDVKLTGTGATWIYPTTPLFTGVKSLTLVEGKLNLDKEVNTKENKGLVDGLTIEKDGVVNVTGTVTLRVNTTNHGTINIGTENAVASLYVSGAAVKFVNEYAPVREADEDSDEEVEDYIEYMWTDCGIINNYGNFGVSNEGQIDNYGLIEMKKASSTALITNNSTSSINLKGDAGDENKIGCINLHADKIAPTVSVTNMTTTKGFIKYTVTNKDNLKQGTGGYGTLANYIVVATDAEITSELTGSGKNMTYLEIASGKTLTLSKTSTFDALIIRDGAQLNINPDTEVTTTATTGVIYMEGDVMHAGKRTASNDPWATAKGAKSYFGEGSGNLIFSGTNVEE